MGRVLFLAVFLFPFSLFAQEDFYHPELNWRTIETEHFLVHFHEGAERSGRTVAKIAEDIYEPVTSLYNHKPDQKVSFIIRDHDDYSNGAAYFFDNKVEIWAPSMEFVFRGTHNWLRNVITHEFTHIVQIQTAMKFGRKLPSFYLQWLGYESERRPDVLYGYPNVIVSYPISGYVIPAWFAEGVAQYNRKELRYDFWDSHRDMILRSYILADSGLTWEQMAVFGKNSHGNESSYNAGFAFVHYLVQKYGEDKLLQISRNLASFGEVTIGGAIEHAVGKSGQQVYDEWRAELKKSYNDRVAPIRANIREGMPMPFLEEGDPSLFGTEEPMKMAQGPSAAIDPRKQMQPCCRAAVDMGFGNLYPRYSPDGKKFAFVSTIGGDYFVQSGLYVGDQETRKIKRVQAGVQSGANWSPDGKQLYYNRTTRDHPHWSLQNDLYVYDLDKEEETRLTHGRRAESPAVSPDNNTIVCVVDSDGTRNLAAMNLDGSNFRMITRYSQGEQVYDPTWSPGGDRILFDYSVKDGNDIAWVRPDGSDLEFLIDGPDDSRSGVFSSNGLQILFSSDRTGIFNLYAYDISTRKIGQVTNVLGGSFLPTMNPKGDVMYSSYTSRGYKLYELRNPAVMAEGEYHYVLANGSSQFSYDGPLAIASDGQSTPQFNWQSLRAYNDSQIPETASKTYKNVFTSLTIVPFLRVDNYNTKNKALDVIKPGVYLFSNDVLDKISFFAGAALNRNLERDLFFQFNYRGKVPGLFQIGLEPTLAAEVYNVTRKTDNVLTLGADVAPVDVTYNLLEFDFVINQPFVSKFSQVEFRYMHSRYTATIENFLFTPAGNLPVLVSGSSDLYLIANDFALTFNSGAVVPSSTMDINPIGRKVSLRIDRELNKFNGDGEYAISSNGTLEPLYKTINFTRVELNWKEYLPLFFKNHTLTLSARGGSILGPAVDEFFDFYAGGLVGMKGYPFYALGGNEMAMLGLTYRFPLFSNIDARFLQLYFSKLYASVFADMGEAWTGDTPALKKFKKDAGVELRLESFSFYSYPTRIFVSAAYGFDKFDRLIRSRNEVVTYGKEWRFYFGILFGFDFD